MLRINPIIILTLPSKIDILNRAKDCFILIIKLHEVFVHCIKHVFAMTTRVM